ncbi:MAG: hypothetical protein Kow0079_16920 [Vicingaceae bacterium]
MKKLLSLVVLLTALSICYAQYATVSPSVVKAFEHPNKKIKVNIILSEQVDCIALKESFNANNTPVEQRAKIVIRKLKQLANQTQQPILEYLAFNQVEASQIKSFWIINMLTVEAKSSIIEQLSHWNNIDYIELYDNQKVKPIDLKSLNKIDAKSINGSEPGLLAINAHLLWQLGYTGKARKLYSIDTGAWINHPAIADAFLGNYWPINQAWNGIDSPVPIDKDGSHGTHTTGTVLGLDPANNDTIGVAFNAYFMSADPIVTNIALIKPLPQYIDVFQFALNPDGDTTSTDDIPDAINNSWGIDIHDDTTICNSYVTQMFDAVEAAGIANIFSAGNEGPGDTTIGQPQYVSTGLVNTFTVGAVNANNTGFPIANFSSRGPTACNVGGGSLAIKPEVVAPGVSVRSAINQNNYAYYQGTSMAGPHAAGAVLLLKEAFPYLTGEQILLALYYSAQDLGAAGEDNTYGMGMIDVYAAYNYLASTYTPVPPNNEKYEVEVSEILYPNGKFLCDTFFTPKCIITNLGDSTITNATIEYHVNNFADSIFSWTGNLSTNQSDTITLPAYSFSGKGDFEFFVKCKLDTSLNENDYINNQRVSRFHFPIKYTGNLPFKEDFENVKLDSSYWYLDNDDASITWDTTRTYGLPYGLYSAYINFPNYLPKSLQKDGLITPLITLPNQDSIYLKFDYAYQGIHALLADSLEVLISDDCGYSWNSLFYSGGDALETNDTNKTNWVPLYPQHWNTKYFDITAYKNKSVLIKFEGTNLKGNNLYLDNIWVYQGTEPQAINEFQTSFYVTVYPNPNNGTFTVNINKQKLQLDINVYSTIGKLVYTDKIKNNNKQLDLSFLPSGIYYIQLSDKQSKQTIKIIKL